jgi:uncharacterized protein (TIGR02996 family)
MPRYEFSEGTSNKFWQIELDGNSFTTTYGKIGTDGQSTIKEFDSPEKAKKEYDKLIAEKVKKGYQLVEGEGDDEEEDEDEGDEDEGDEGEDGDENRNPTLEAAILAKPDDAHAYAVYGDWLQSVGDVRGELIALQHAGKKDAAAKYIEKHKAELLTATVDDEEIELDDKDIAELEWENGFIKKARLAAKYDGPNLDQVYSAFMKLGSARFCRQLTLGPATLGDENHYENVVTVLNELGLPPLVDNLFIGDFTYEDSELSWSHLGDISGLWKKFAKLKRLKVRMGSMTFGKIVLPELTSFSVETGGLDKDSLKSILKADWPKLEYLEIYLGQDNYGGDCTLEDLQPILDGKIPKGVKHLSLCNNEIADELAGVIGDAKVLAQLEVLDLSKSTLSDEGARQIIAHAKKFAHLKTLDLSECYLSDDVVAELEKLGKHIEAGAQRDDDDPDYRHSVVGE